MQEGRIKYGLTVPQKKKKQKVPLPAEPTTKDLLEAIQGLGKKLDKFQKNTEKEIDKLRKRVKELEEKRPIVVDRGGLHDGAIRYGITKPKS